MGPKPIPSKDLREDTLVNAIKVMKNNYVQFSNSAKVLVEKIKSENGLESAVELIKNIVELQNN